MIATFIKTRLQIKSYVIHFIDHRDLMFPNMLHLTGALAMVLYSKVSSSTFSNLYKKNETKSIFFYLGYSSFMYDILYTRTLRYNILILIGERDQCPY